MGIVAKPFGEELNRNNEVMDEHLLLLLVINDCFQQKNGRVELKCKKLTR